MLYATVEIWYLTQGRPEQDVQRARQRAPWNVGKREPSFTDMLASARREVLFPCTFDGTASDTGCLEIDLDLVELLLAA